MACCTRLCRQILEAMVERVILPQLNKRSKWHSKQANLQVGDMVLIVEENVARGKWTTGVVEAVYPERDG